MTIFGVVLVKNSIENKKVYYFILVYRSLFQTNSEEQRLQKLQLEVNNEGMRFNECLFGTM